MKLTLMRTHRFHDGVNRNLFFQHPTSSSITSKSSFLPTSRRRNLSAVSLLTLRGGMIFGGREPQTMNSTNVNQRMTRGLVVAERLLYLALFATGLATIIYWLLV